MSKYSFEFKKKVVKAYLNGEGGYGYLSKTYGVPAKSKIEEWVHNYQKFGDVLDRTITNLNENRIVRLVHDDSQDTETSIVSNIVQWINNHYSEDISLQCLSSEFHLSSAYISQLFKNKIGTNYFTYLSKIRLNKAKQLLLTSDLSISEIAEMVGYKDYRSFTRAYKSVMGKQPSSERILSKVTS